MQRLDLSAEQTTEPKRPAELKPRMGFVKRITTLMASMLAACLAAQPSEAGDFVSQFEDLEDVGNHIISGGPGRDGAPRRG